jgi:hypothetical protein
VDLAVRICSCKPNRLERDTCERQAKAMQVPTTDAEKEQCSALLDTCSCQALERSELVACGLAKPPG